MVISSQCVNVYCVFPVKNLLNRFTFRVLVVSVCLPFHAS